MKQKLSDGARVDIFPERIVSVVAAQDKTLKTVKNVIVI
jgi:hypothetical protein